MLIFSKQCNFINKTVTNYQTIGDKTIWSPKMVARKANLPTLKKVDQPTTTKCVIKHHKRKKIK